MRGGRKRRDVRRSRRRTHSRSDDERWRGVHRLRRVHKARVGNAGETAPALDSQIYGGVRSRAILRNIRISISIAERAGKAGVLSHDDVCAHICIGGRSLSCGDGRRNKAIEVSGRAGLTLLVVVHRCKSKGGYSK